MSSSISKIMQAIRSSVGKMLDPRPSGAGPGSSSAPKPPPPPPPDPVNIVPTMFDPFVVSNDKEILRDSLKIRLHQEKMAAAAAIKAAKATETKAEAKDESKDEVVKQKKNVHVHDSTPIKLVIPTPTDIIRQVIKPHVPLIKFRKGAPLTKDIPVMAAATATPAQSVPADAPLASAGSSTNLWKPVLASSREWWDTPTKFRRRSVDDLECDLINSGGCDKIYQ